MREQKTVYFGDEGNFTHPVDPQVQDLSQEAAKNHEGRGVLGRMPRRFEQVVSTVLILGGIATAYLTFANEANANVGAPEDTIEQMNGTSVPLFNPYAPDRGNRPTSTPKRYNGQNPVIADTIDENNLAFDYYNYHPDIIGSDISGRRTGTVVYNSPLCGGDGSMAVVVAQRNDDGTITRGWHCDIDMRPEAPPTPRPKPTSTPHMERQLVEICGPVENFGVGVFAFFNPSTWDNIGETETVCEWEWVNVPVHGN